MKLTKDRFMSVLAYLSANYQKFDFKLKDGDEPSYEFGVWYDSLKDFDEEEFVGMIKMYCKDNVYPPSSPAQIIKYAKDKIIGWSMSVDEAWEISLERLRKYGYDIVKVCKTFRSESKVVIADTIREMKSEFEGVYTQNLPFVKNTFKEVYTRNLTGKVERNLSQGLLSVGSVKMLGKGE